jgi:hypothetical protein
LELLFSLNRTPFAPKAGRNESKILGTTPHNGLNRSNPPEKWNLNGYSPLPCWDR